MALYGPDDRTTTKIVAGVILREGAEPVLMRWVGTNVMENARVQQELKEFFTKHGVKQVAMTDGNLGCPHEEGIDFPNGEDCPFCPFWAGKQGSAMRDDDEWSRIDVEDEMDNLKEERAAASLKRVAARLADTARGLA